MKGEEKGVGGGQGVKLGVNIVGGDHGPLAG